MYEKNYISREEYKIWRYIKDNEIVTGELIWDVFPEISKDMKNKILHNLYRKGYLKRVKRDLYYNPILLKSFYELALIINEGYIGFGSALRYYNLLNYEDFTIFVATKDFQKTIIVKDVGYEIKFIPMKDFFTGFEKKGGLYVSSVEKTFFDCFLKPGLIGFTNLTKAMYDTKIDWKKFISFFKLTDNHSLFQRTGYILEVMKKNTDFKVPFFVFGALMKKVKNPVKLMSFNGKSTFSRKWMVQDNIGEKNIISWWY